MGEGKSVDLVPLIVTNTLMLAFNLAVAGVEYWWLSLLVMPPLLWVFREGGRANRAVVSAGVASGHGVIRMARRANEFFEQATAPSVYQRKLGSVGRSKTPNGPFAFPRHNANRASTNDMLVSWLTRSSDGVVELVRSYWSTLDTSMAGKLDPERPHNRDRMLTPLVFFVVACAFGALAVACGAYGSKALALLPKTWGDVSPKYFQFLLAIGASVLLFALAEASHWAVRLSFLLLLFLTVHEQLAGWLAVEVWLSVIVVSAVRHIPNLRSEFPAMLGRNEQRSVRWDRILIGLGLLASLGVGACLSNEGHVRWLDLWFVVVSCVMGVVALKRVEQVHWKFALDTMATLVSVFAPILALVLLLLFLNRWMVPTSTPVVLALVGIFVFNAWQFLRWNIPPSSSMLVPLLVVISASGYGKDRSVPGHIQVTPTAVHFRPCGEQKALPLMFNKNTPGWSKVQEAIENEGGVNQGWEHPPEVLWARLTRSAEEGEQIVVEHFCCTDAPKADTDDDCYRKCPNGDENACQEPKSAEAP